MKKTFMVSGPEHMPLTGKLVRINQIDARKSKPRLFDFFFTF